jgi:ABC-2 type transport system ATP-binding protein
VLQINHLFKSFGSRPVLQDLSLQIAAGEVYALLGANGAGKTTTINIICNLLRADRGQVLINGQLPGLGLLLNRTCSMAS